jgi:hypothetical protein
MSFATQEDRGAKPTGQLNSTRSISLPLTRMVDEETGGHVNPIGVLFFADQLIERREIHAYNGTH